MSGRHAAPADRDDEWDGRYGGSEDDVFEIELVPPEPALPRHDASQRRREEPLHRTMVAARPPAPGAIAARQVRYARAGRLILDDVSVHAQPGESVALVGPSGSGKTSLLALLAGLERPDAGTVAREADARVGLILQSYGLVGVLTGAENVEAPLQAGALGRMARGDVRRRSAAALDAVGLAEVSDHLIEELSGGQQQRVAIARALATEPDIVFADELTAELDHDWKNVVVGLVLDVAARGGIVVLATHDLELAGRCDRIVRITDGRVAPDGS